MSRVILRWVDVTESQRSRNLIRKAQRAREEAISAALLLPAAPSFSMEKGLIAVDQWAEESEAYFLTHLHADHTQGLSPRWKKGPLFCSPISAALFPAKFPGFDLSFLRILNIGSPHSVSVISPISGRKVAFQVTAIDAHHCPDEDIGQKPADWVLCASVLQMAGIELAKITLFVVVMILLLDFCCFVYLNMDDCRWVTGFIYDQIEKTNNMESAVMYLFRGEFGCKLYTGDFRWETASDRAQLGRSMLLNALGDDKVDILYIDNTFCNPLFSFPPREVAAQQVVDIIASHPDHEIVIGIDRLGKEDLLIYISHALKTKICVWPERLQIMHLLKLKDVFTTRTCLTRIRAVPRNSFTIENLEAMNTICPTIGILPSGLAWGTKLTHERDAFLGAVPSAQRRSKDRGNSIGERSISPKCYKGYIYYVPYSEHSCFHEIHEFVKLIKPWNIAGIVASSFCYINPRHFLGYLCGANQQSNNSSVKKLKRRKPPEDTKFQTECVLGDEEISGDTDTAWDANYPKLVSLRTRRQKMGDGSARSSASRPRCSCFHHSFEQNKINRPQLPLWRRVTCTVTKQRTPADRETAAGTGPILAQCEYGFPRVRALTRASASASWYGVSIDCTKKLVVLWIWAAPLVNYGAGGSWNSERRLRVLKFSCE
ncbi:hypothetical protein ACLOJK_039743 [Asimina triloba]